MPATANPQTALYETVIDNPDLEKALEQRESRKASRAALQKQFKAADDQVKAELGKLDLGDDAPVRIGRVVITQKPVAGRSVSFDTEPTSRLAIKTLNEAA